VTFRPALSHWARATDGVPVVAHATMPRPRRSTASRGRPGASASRRDCDSDTARENHRPLRVRAYAMQLVRPSFA